MKNESGVLQELKLIHADGLSDNKSKGSKLTTCNTPTLAITKKVALTSMWPLDNQYPGKITKTWHYQIEGWQSN